MLNLTQINFDATELKIKDDSSQRRFWIAPGNTLVEQTLIIPTDFTHDLSQPDDFRQDMHDQAHEMGSALLECDFLEVQGLAGVKLVNKFWSSPKPEEMGIDYNGSLIFPLAEGCFFIRVAAREAGMTGVREALVTALLHKQGKLELAKTAPPTDTDASLTANLKKHVLVPSPSDDKQYDADFPEHPLTRVRRMLQHVETTLSVSSELKNAMPYRAK